MAKYTEYDSYDDNAPHLSNFKILKYDEPAATVVTSGELGEAPSKATNIDGVISTKPMVKKRKLMKACQTKHATNSDIPSGPETAAIPTSQKRNKDDNVAVTISVSCSSFKKTKEN